MAGPVSPRDERDYRARAEALAATEAMYYPAWLNAAGEPQIEDYQGFASLSAAIADAHAWQPETEETVCVVRGTIARAIVFVHGEKVA
jgi:hypothetical protein